MTPRTLLVILSLFTAIQTLSIQNQSLLKEIEHFELSNRPFIGIINQRIDIEDYTTDPRRGILPEVIYKVSVNLKNYGKLPAYVENIECIVMNIEGNRAEPFMPYPGDKEKQWHNFDLFPDSTMPVTICPLINIDAVKQLMINDSLNSNDLRNKNSKFWNQSNDIILGELRRCIEPFYLIFQIKYYMIDNERKVYFYTSQFKIETDLSTHLFNSSSKQWFEFDNNGQLTWLNREYRLQNEKKP